MKIIEVKPLVFPEVKTIRYAHFNDERGFFTETYKKSDFRNNPALGFLNNFEFSQCNVSYSRKHVVRGLHFQWQPYIGKLVRTVKGRMIDLFLDIREGSPNFGQIAGHDMPASFEDTINQWIWIPVGFAHGGVYLEDTQIEYFCTGEYNPSTEAVISPLAQDIDWSFCDINIKKHVEEVLKSNPLLSQKDKDGNTMASWKNNTNSKNFVFEL